jgi:energy-coupling factor transporter ATP-binding protein EcfA2
MILKLENIFYKYRNNAPYILNGVSYEFEKGAVCYNGRIRVGKNHAYIYHSRA